MLWLEISLRLRALRIILDKNKKKGGKKKQVEYSDIFELRYPVFW